ncbi:MAG: hypothetical protein MRJ92_13530 [Nitrospira sp.]|nr:hypothetical protein [Nitrospira sp.]
MAEFCSHLFIDEAHHAEATAEDFPPTLRGQFNRTVHGNAIPRRRTEGRRKVGFVYPLRKAQEEVTFDLSGFRQVHRFDAARGDRKIAESALDELDEDVTGKHIVMAR